MGNVRLIAEFWPVFAAGIGFVVWLARLESKTGENWRYTTAVDRKVDVLNIKHDSLDSKTVEQLAQVRESLARIEGALGVKST